MGQSKILEIQSKERRWDEGNSPIVDGTLPEDGPFDYLTPTVKLAARASETWQALERVYQLVLLCERWWCLRWVRALASRLCTSQPPLRRLDEVEGYILSMHLHTNSSSPNGFIANSAQITSIIRPAFFMKSHPLFWNDSNNRFSIH